MATTSQFLEILAARSKDGHDHAPSDESGPCLRCSSEDVPVDADPAVKRAEGLSADDAALLAALGDGITVRVERKTVKPPVLPATVRSKAPAVASASESEEESSLSPVVLGILRDFYELQRERVHTYRSFEDAFTVLLESDDFSSYSSVIADVTATFSKISKGVLDCEARLTASEAPHLATRLRAIQEQEKQKLGMTAELQVLRQRLRMLENAPDDGAAASSDDDADPDGADRSPAGHAGASSTSATPAAASRCLPGPAVPLSKKMLDARINEVRAVIDKCVGAINEILEELRSEEE